MTMFTKYARPASLLLAAGLGLGLGACSDHGEYRINNVCNRFCDRVVDCNDTVVFENCVDDCVDEAGSCQSDDDIAAALDILDECSSDACNRVSGCLVEAIIECNL